jgi:PhnB protein
MKALQPYLFFNGNCREAMEFYANALGGKLNMMPYSQAPQPPAEDADRIMHANIVTSGGSTLMASDAPPGHPVPEGKNFSLSIACDSREEQERIFGRLSEGGVVRQALQDTFWGAHFGMLQDRFGVTWMLSHHEQQA